MAKMVFINDDFIDEKKAVLHLSDLSIQRGYGIFDFFRLIGNEPLFLKDHLDRFYSSAEGMHMQVTHSRQEIANIILELINRNNLPGTGIRLQLTGGYSADGFTMAKPNLIISQQSFASPSREQRENGIKLLSYPFQRQLSHVKTIDYLMAIWLQPELKEKGFNDALYHQNGIITECPRSNFFMITTDNVLVTPDENILAGVTKKKLLELARNGFKVEERAIHSDELNDAKEAFVTSTTKHILPVIQIDETILPERKMTMALSQLFKSCYKC